MGEDSGTGHTTSSIPTSDSEDMERKLSNLGKEFNHLNFKS